MSFYDLYFKNYPVYILDGIHSPPASISDHSILKDAPLKPTKEGSPANASHATYLRGPVKSNSFYNNRHILISLETSYVSKLNNPTSTINRIYCNANLLNEI